MGRTRRARGKHEPEEDSELIGDLRECGAIGDLGGDRIEGGRSSGASVL